MTALPTMTSGLRALADRLGGGGSCSGSSAARGLRGEMGGLSLIDDSSSRDCGWPEEISEPSTHSASSKSLKINRSRPPRTLSLNMAKG
jgi:hypothetical protein